MKIQNRIVRKSSSRAGESQPRLTTGSRPPLSTREKRRLKQIAYIEKNGTPAQVDEMHGFFDALYQTLAEPRVRVRFRMGLVLRSIVLAAAKRRKMSLSDFVERALRLELVGEGDAK